MRLAIVLVLVGCAATTDPKSQQPAPGSATADPGPRSGLDEAALARSLSPADRAALCAWDIANLGAGRSQHCSECHGDACDDWNVTVDTQAQCEAWVAGLQCDATVAELEDCSFAQQPDLCASPAACEVFIGC